MAMARGRAAAAVMVHSYGNVNNSSATTTLVGGLATLYRMFDGTTYQDAYDTSGGGGGTAYTDQTGTVNAIGGLKPLVYHYNDAAFKPYVQNNILAPGLIAMQIIQQSFSHSSSSFMIGKIQKNIVIRLLNINTVHVCHLFYNCAGGSGGCGQSSAVR